MGAMCNNSHGCFSKEEEKGTVYFSNNFPFKDKNFAFEKEETKAKNNINIDSNVIRSNEKKNSDIDNETINLSIINHTYIDNGGEMYENVKNKNNNDANDKKSPDTDKKIVESRYKMNTDKQDKETSFKINSDDKFLHNQNLSKINRIKYKFIFFLFRKKLDRLKAELELLTEKMYYSYLVQYVNKDINYPSFDYTTHENTFNNNPQIIGFKRIIFLKTRILLRNNTFYSGQVNLENMKHGLGINRLADKSSYEGYWVNDEFLCGRYIDKSGTLYEGNFVKGKINGLGTKITKDSIIYKGKFVNGFRSGKGTEKSKHYVYEGSFENDLKQGKGKIIFNNQEEIYEGDFYEDQITGAGTFTWKNNDKYVGQVLNKKMHGRGTYYWSDGSEYVGEYFDNIKEGEGKFKWTNGNIFEGTFSKGVPNGKGFLTVKGNKYECEFLEGKLFRKGDLVA